LDGNILKNVTDSIGQTDSVFVEHYLVNLVFFADST